MNLVSHFEEHGGMFYYTTVMIVALMAGLGYSAMCKMSDYNII